MKKIIETIPNFSEGRDNQKINAITKPYKNTDGIHLLDFSTDRDHNRLVVTAIGNPKGVKKATLKAIETAIDVIDMNTHRGQHPRMGAVDVVPFTPVLNVTMDEVVDFSREVARESAHRFDLPIYLYEESASNPQRKNLATIRKGEFEGFAEKISRDRWNPDFGPSKIHPTAGVTAMGARMPLVAFNVNLATDNIEIAQNIARKIRQSSGGLQHCKAIGVELDEKNRVQVSMNLTNYRQTPIYQALEMIKIEAKKYGIGVAQSEIIGLVPAQALLNSIEYYLQLSDFNSDQLMESRLLEIME